MQSTSAAQKWKCLYKKSTPFTVKWAPVCRKPSQFISTSFPVELPWKRWLSCESPPKAISGNTTMGREKTGFSTAAKLPRTTILAKSLSPFSSSMPETTGLQPSRWKVRNCLSRVAVFQFQDALELYRQLPQAVRAGIYGVEKLNFNHNDFFFGRNADELFNKPLMEILNQFLAKQRAGNNTSPNPPRGTVKN